MVMLQQAYANSQLHTFQHNQVNLRYNFINLNSEAHSQNIGIISGLEKWDNINRRGTNRNFCSYIAELM